ncbi:(Fe-S)-binding protein [Mesorhizobium sp. LHD-90]|uniref:(Fe-S)-binding protein n=1 Tax=Mesorhizobium sp. LHD-90 TaxID=3071414 RepID=UPI0027E0E9C1|nr:(Fe-S)-binding protein [Mesorhizobium sp. LHD-90]MDQ6435198.1 (Fe-S)-binding protein [Mesorhizobium sp. LHD-90]
MPTSCGQHRPRAGLFVTCLVDLFRPSVGLAAARLLEAAGCGVEIPRAQTCCGQSALASNDRAEARAAAESTIETFEGFDYIVAPSASCASMLRHRYPTLFAGDAAWEARAKTFAAKVHELVSFLTDVLGIEKIAAGLDASATYHDSCAGLHAFGIRRQPRALLESVEGLDLIEMRDAGSCCGFGGSFCTPYAKASKVFAERKVGEIGATGAEILLAGELGCLMHMAGRLKRNGSTVEVRHIAEVLAGMTDAPSIGGND